MQLPETYKEAMKSLLGEEYALYEHALDLPYKKGIRVNTKKISAEAFLKLTPFSLEPIPWVDNGFYYTDEPVTRHPHYFAGLYYVQEPSAMIPASRLPVSPGCRILDLCAAPGGKSTELGARLCGEGILYANDISHSRAKALLKNLELFGIENCFITSETPEKLLKQFPEYFDRILIDAPCSGEGMFRKEPSMVKEWEQKGPDYYAPLQREILDSAYQMLSGGGFLVYSTCTFSKMEDEENIQWFLEKHSDMKVAAPGYTRIFPHTQDGEGHFAVLLEKTGAATEKISTKTADNWNASDCKEFEAFMKEIPRFSKKRYFRLQDEIYLLPEGETPRKGLRYLRTGLSLGEIKKDRFKPSQALAMAMQMSDYPRCISFPSDDERVLRYLKGETLDLSGTPWADLKGWILVCTDGYPLGFAKAANETLKNKYYAGWRMQ